MGTPAPFCSRSSDPPAPISQRAPCLGDSFVTGHRDSFAASDPAAAGARPRPSHPTTPLLMAGVIFNAKCDRARRRPVASKIPEQEHPQGQTPVRAIALSISSVPVAAPAPGHDLRRHLMTASSRARKRGEDGERGSLYAVDPVNPPGADFTKSAMARGSLRDRAGIVSPPPTLPPPGPDLATSHPDDAIANGRGYLQRQMRSSSPAPASKIPEQEHPQGQDPRSRDRAVDQQRPRSCAGAGHDPRRHLMTASSRAHEKTRRASESASNPRLRGRAVDQQRPRSCAGARPRPPPPPDDGLLTRACENAVEDGERGSVCAVNSMTSATRQFPPKSTMGRGSLSSTTHGIVSPPSGPAAAGARSCHPSSRRRHCSWQGLSSTPDAIELTGSRVASQKSRARTPTGKTPVRAIALSISSIPVAAPAPGHDLRRRLMTAASRAHEKTRRAWGTRLTLPVDPVNPPGADYTKSAVRRG